MPTTGQLCFAHEVHLAVCDVLYKSKGMDLTNFEIVVEDNEDEVFNEEDEYSFGFVIENSDVEEQREITNQFSNLLSLLTKVRTIIKKSADHLWPIKMDKLKELVLFMDCQTRWSSTYLMLKRFVYLKSAIDKAIYDERLEKVTVEDWFLLESIVKSLGSVNLALKKLCDRKSTLLTADTTMTFLICRLGESI